MFSLQYKENYRYFLVEKKAPYQELWSYEHVNPSISVLIGRISDYKQFIPNHSHSVPGANVKIHDGIIYHSLNPHYPQVSAVVVLDTDKAYFLTRKYSCFSYFSMKTYFVDAH